MIKLGQTFALIVGIVVCAPLWLLAYVIGVAYASVSQGFRRGQVLYHLSGPLNETATSWSPLAKSDSLKQMRRLVGE